MTRFWTILLPVAVAAPAVAISLNSLMAVWQVLKTVLQEVMAVWQVLKTVLQELEAVWQALKTVIHYSKIAWQKVEWETKTLDHVKTCL